MALTQVGSFEGEVMYKQIPERNVLFEPFRLGNRLQLLVWISHCMSL